MLLRVLVVCDELLPPRTYMAGGKNIYNIYRISRYKGIEFTILTSNTVGTDFGWREWVACQRKEGIKICVVNSPLRRFGKVNFLWVRLVYFIYALNLSLRYKYHIIHEYSSSPFLINRTYLLGLLTGARTVHTLCTVNEYLLGSTRGVLKTTDKVICVTKEMQKNLEKKIPKEKIELSSIPIEDRFFDLSVSPCKDKFRIKTEKAILFSGLLDDRKGISTFLLTVPEIMRSNLDTTIVIVTPARINTSSVVAGYKEKIARLAKEYQDRVIFIEEQLDMHLLFSSADIFVYPLLTMHGTFGSPSTLIEAMATGKAIVASRLPEIAEIVKDQENGLLFEPGDVKDLIQCINKLLKDGKQRRYLGKQARKDGKRYRLSEVSQKTMDLYEELKETIKPREPAQKSEKLKIAMVVSIPFKTGSWIGRYMPIARCLAKRGYGVRVLMPNHEHKKEGYPLAGAENVTVYDTGIPMFKELEGGRQNYSTITLIIIAIKNIFRAIKLLMYIRPDIVYICKPLPMGGVVGVLFKVITGKKIIVDCDDLEVVTNAAQSALQRKIIQVFEYVIPKFSRIVTTNTTYNMNRLNQNGIPQSKIIYLANGVDVERFNKASAETHKMQFAGKRVILYCGDLNLLSGHDVDILLQAFKQVVPLYPTATLLIIGDGKDETKLKQLALDLNINHNIHWMRRIKPDKVPDYMAISDIVVDPVRNVLGNWARCPLKILEAMCLGKTVITSDIGDRRRLLGEYGYFVREGDPDSLAKGILDVLNSDKVDKLNSFLMEKALEYSWDTLCDTLESVIKKMVENDSCFHG